MLVWVVRADLRGVHVIASLVTAALLGVARLVTRGTMQFVLSSLLGTALAAYFAMRSGRAEAAFLPGILISAGYFVATLLSVVTRWPVVGFLVGADLVHSHTWYANFGAPGPGHGPGARHQRGWSRCAVEG
ncbi:DUF3159 domain-containing protein [Arsenicicoccus piscis]|nr:DUF3159 domain-containing protein [Arsenicicoccus piscis]